MSKNSNCARAPGASDRRRSAYDGKQRDVDGVDRALVGHHRAGALGSALGGRDHRGHGRLGLAVHIGGPIQQLGGGELLRDQPEKGHLDVAAAQNGARCGVLKALRGVVERVVLGQHRTDAPLDRLMRYGADPLGTGGRRDIAQVHRASIA